MRTRAALVLLTLLLSVLPAAAQSERILTFDSQVIVEKDGSLTVREDIRVRAAGNQIKHGIYRDFPVRYAGGLFTRKTVTFDLEQVLRDGRPEGYHFADEGDFQRVYIGRKDVLVGPGEYTYTLVYRTKYQLGFFEDHDELYWNATGNEWDFPIDCATCTVTLPAGVPQGEVRLEAYTGPRGARGRDYTSEAPADGGVRFRTTRPLGRQEGLTVVVGWPKGFVTPPGAAEKFYRFLYDNATLGAAGVGFVLVLLYYLWAWTRVGRDPEKGLIIPLFNPPDGVSPAAARFIRRMHFDKDCFTAAVIDAAVKGFLTIEQDGSDFTLTKTDHADPSALSDDEKPIATRLLASKDRIKLENANHTRFRGTMEQMRKTLAKAFKGTLFHLNLAYFIAGLAASVLTVVVAGLANLLTGNPERALGFVFMCLWLSVWSVGVFALVATAVQQWRSVARGGGGAPGAIFISLFSIPFVAGELVGFGVLVAFTSLWMLPLLVGFIVLNIAFYYLLRAPTVEGRRVMDHIDGFRMYLSTAEADYLQSRHPPEKTPELFERYLPYALALGVGNAWAEKFSGVLAAAGRETEGGYRPLWYSGTAFASIGAAAFASSLGSSFSSAVSAASTAPGSSSGFSGGGGGGGGGGGSSGGGGGGGGGGGW